MQLISDMLQQVKEELDEIKGQIDGVGGQIKFMHQDLKAALMEIRDDLEKGFSDVSRKIDSGDAAAIQVTLALQESIKNILAEV